MTKGFPRLYKVTLRLFVYHLQAGSSTDLESVHLSRSQIQSYYEALLNDYRAMNPESRPLQVRWREDTPETKIFDLLQTEPLNGRHIQTFVPACQMSLSGFIYPQQFDDSYIGSVTLYLPNAIGQEGLAIAQLQDFQPSTHFLESIATTDRNKEAETLNSALKTAFLGNTLLLSAYLKVRSPNQTEFAQTCLLNLLGIESPEGAPTLRYTWNFLRGSIYEFDSHASHDTYGKIWLFLTFNEEDIDRLDDVQFDLVELFLYAHKNQTNYDSGRVEYEKGLVKLAQIEDIVKGLPSNIPAENRSSSESEYLDRMKDYLKTLLDMSIDYSQILRSLKNLENNIDIHWYNYEEKIFYIERIANSNLIETLKIADRDFRRFQKQISANLNYLAEGSRLLETAIATIRGLVEIEQAESDRKLQQQNEELQDYIQALGFGIGAGAILASASGSITQGWYFPNGKKLDISNVPHPFLIGFFGSIIIAIAVFNWQKYSLKQKRKGNINNN